MTNFIKNFRADESGAVTVDWVVLTAAVVGLAIAVIAAVRPGLTNVANAIGDGLTESSTTLGDLNFGGTSGGGD